MPLNSSLMKIMRNWRRPRRDRDPEHPEAKWWPRGHRSVADRQRLRAMMRFGSLPA